MRSNLHLNNYTTTQSQITKLFTSIIVFFFLLKKTENSLKTSDYPKKTKLELCLT